MSTERREQGDSPVGCAVLDGLHGSADSGLPPGGLPLDLLAERVNLLNGAVAVVCGELPGLHDLDPRFLDQVLKAVGEAQRAMDEHPVYGRHVGSRDLLIEIFAEINRVGDNDYTFSDVEDRVREPAWRRGIASIRSNLRVFSFFRQAMVGSGEVTHDLLPEMCEAIGDYLDRIVGVQGLREMLNSDSPDDVQIAQVPFDQIRESGELLFRLTRVVNELARGNLEPFADLVALRLASEFEQQAERSGQSVFVETIRYRLLRDELVSKDSRDRSWVSALNSVAVNLRNSEYGDEAQQAVCQYLANIVGVPQLEELFELQQKYHQAIADLPPEEVAKEARPEVALPSLEPSRARVVGEEIYILNHAVDELVNNQNPGYFIDLVLQRLIDFHDQQPQAGEATDYFAISLLARLQEQLAGGVLVEMNPYTQGRWVQRILDVLEQCRTVGFSPQAPFGNEEIQAAVRAFTVVAQGDPTVQESLLSVWDQAVEGSLNPDGVFFETLSPSQAVQVERFLYVLTNSVRNLVSGRPRDFVEVVVDRLVQVASESAVSDDQTSVLDPSTLRTMREFFLRFNSIVSSWSQQVRDIQSATELFVESDARLQGNPSVGFLTTIMLMGLEAERGVSAEAVQILSAVWQGGQNRVVYFDALPDHPRVNRTLSRYQAMAWHELTGDEEPSLTLRLCEQVAGACVNEATNVRESNCLPTYRQEELAAYMLSEGIRTRTLLLKKLSRLAGEDVDISRDQFKGARGYAKAVADYLPAGFSQLSLSGRMASVRQAGREMLGNGGHGYYQQIIRSAHRLEVVLSELEIREAWIRVLALEAQADLVLGFAERVGSCPGDADRGESLAEAFFQFAPVLREEQRNLLSTLVVNGGVRS